MHGGQTDRQMDRMTDNTTTVCRGSAPRHKNVHYYVALVHSVQDKHNMILGYIYMHGM